MASTDVIDAAQDKAKWQSRHQGNASAYAFSRAEVSYSADANQTLSLSEYECPIIDVVSGFTLTATRDLIFPLKDGAWYTVTNEATGAQSIVCKASSGTGVTIATGKSAMIRCDGTNYRRVTADVTP